MRELKTSLLAILVGLTIALMAWVGNSIVSLGQRVSAAEAHQESMGKWLERVERKLDQALAHR